MSPGRLAAIGLCVALAAGGVHASAVDDFWYWFEYEHAVLADPERAAEGQEALSYWLGRIDRGLSFELDTSKRRKRLVISADGNVQLFRRVELMVEQAPKVRGWKLVAFRQKTRRLTAVQVDPVVIDPETLFFDLYRDGARIGVVFYLPEFLPEHQESYRLAAMRLLCQAVGEWDVGMEIGFVDFDNQQVRDMQFSRPFAEFRRAFAELRK